MVGLQIIPINPDGNFLPESYNLRIKELITFIRKNKDLMDIADDFSGTSIRRKYLSEFFESLVFGTSYLEQLINRTIDTKFMTYIQNLPNGGISEKITVFNRIKEYKSVWRDGYILD